MEPKNEILSQFHQLEKLKSDAKAYFKSVPSEFAQEIELFLEILSKII